MEVPLDSLVNLRTTLRQIVRLSESVRNMEATIEGARQSLLGLDAEEEHDGFDI